MYFSYKDCRKASESNMQRNVETADIIEFLRERGYSTLCLDQVEPILDGILSGPGLCREEEEILGASAEDIEIKKKIIPFHFRTVLAIAVEYAVEEDSFLDFIHDGTIALSTAWDERAGRTDGQSFADFAEPYIRRVFEWHLAYGSPYFLDFSELQRLVVEYRSFAQSTGSRPTALEWMQISGLISSEELEDIDEFGELIVYDFYLSYRLEKAREAKFLVEG
jgi:hypothetical protein